MHVDLVRLYRIDYIFVAPNCGESYALSMCTCSGIVGFITHNSISHTIAYICTYRFDSHALQIWHCTLSLRTVLPIWMLLMCASTSLRVVNVFAQYSQISVFGSLSVSWMRFLWLCCNFSVVNLIKTITVRINTWTEERIYQFYFLTFYCKACMENCVQFFRHDIVYEHQGDILTSKFCRILRS